MFWHDNEEFKNSIANKFQKVVNKNDTPILKKKTAFWLIHNYLKKQKIIPKSCQINKIAELFLFENNYI